MPRLRRWEPNDRLVDERERRGWSQEEAAREAEKVADRLGRPDLVFTGAQFGRWERGECRPRPPLRRVVCELYEASAEALGLLDQGDGAANRRDVLRNAVVLGAAAVVSPAWSGEGAAGATEEPAEVASIRDALMDYGDLWDDEIVDLVDLRSLDCQVQQAWQARQAAAYRQLGVLLPRVLERAQLAVRQSNSDRRRAANRLLAETYQCVGFAMANTGRSDLAWIAADRGILAAKQSEDRLMVAASSRLLAHALLAMGRHDKAQQVALTALTTLERGLGTAVPAHLFSIYGALLQTSAVVAARRGDRAGATEFLTEAGVIAQRLGEDRNDFWTVFGPTNVGIHGASVSVELGDAGRAVEQARAIDSSQLPSLERRAHHLLDLAQGYGQWRKDHEALDALLHAERLAPQEVHQQPVVQRLVVELLHRERRTTKPRLRELATRVGVLAA